MAAPVGPKKVNRYTVEFKIQAVKLASHPEIALEIRDRSGQRVLMERTACGLTTGSAGRRRVRDGARAPGR